MFQDQYKADNEKITPDPALIKYLSVRMKDAASVPAEATNPAYNLKKHRILRPAAAIAACLAIALSAGGLYIHYDKLPNQPESSTVTSQTTVTSTEPVKHAATYSELYALIKSMEQKSGANIQNDVAANIVKPGAENKGAKPAATQAANQAASSADHSNTNTQVQDVDEADIVKTDGRFIYTLTQNKLRIVSVSGAEMKSVSVIDFAVANKDAHSAFPSEFYVNKDRLVVIQNAYGHNKLGCIDAAATTEPVSAAVYDISDHANPKLLGNLGQSGSYLSSRLVGQTLYLITNHAVYQTAVQDSPETYIPSLYKNGTATVMDAKNITVSDNPQDRQYVVVTAIDIQKPDQHLSSKTVFGCGTTLYASTDNLLVANPFSEETQSGTTGITNSAEPIPSMKTAPTKAASTETATSPNVPQSTVKLIQYSTELLRFSLNNGKIEFAASGKVAGTPLNQFSMDEHKGVFRIVTTVTTNQEVTKGSGSNAYVTYTPGEPANALYMLNEKLQIIGRIENLAKNERVYSVRFSGDIAYFVTFRRTDPLFSVDLSNPAKPTILSELKIPGFSNYLHPWSSSLLFGLGYDADANGRTNFLKISMFDVSNPANVTEKHKLVLNGFYYSEATNNHKAILVSPERGIIAFSANGKYLVYSYSEKGFEKKAELTFSINDYRQRALYIGNVFYVCTSDAITAYSMDNYAKLGSLVYETGADR